MLTIKQYITIWSQIKIERTNQKPNVAQQIQEETETNQNATPLKTAN